MWEHQWRLGMCRSIYIVRRPHRMVQKRVWIKWYLDQISQSANLGCNTSCRAIGLNLFRSLWSQVFNGMIASKGDSQVVYSRILWICLTICRFSCSSLGSLCVSVSEKNQGDTTIMNTLRNIEQDEDQNFLMTLLIYFQRLSGWQKLKIPAKYYEVKRFSSITSFYVILIFLK